MYFPYGIWKDAEREAKRLPPSDNNGCGLIFVLLIGGLVVYSLMSAGGLGILLGLAALIGIFQGLSSK
jgi:hypothetical protein